jgi:phosphatidylglycerol:prolipoprotein diacylglycerol transferase
MHPILVHVGSLYLRSYTVFAALGVVLSFMFLKTRQKQMGLRGGADYWTLVNTLVASGFVGARLVGMILGEGSASTTIWRRLSSIDGNFSVFGLIAGVSAGAYLYSRLHKLPYVRLLDYIAFIFPVWLAWGRLGCFLNGCCYGRPSGGRLGWSVSFRSLESAVPRELLGVPLHPTQLYEAGGSIVLVGFLYLLLQGTEKARYGSGSVCAGCFAGYGALRFVVEWFRGDSALLPGTPLTVGQVLSLALISVAGAFFALVHRERRMKGSTSTVKV